MKKYIALILVLFSLLFPARQATADLVDTPLPNFNAMMGGTAMSTMVHNVHNMAKTVSLQSKEMMKFGDMLWCSAWNSDSATRKIMGWEFTFPLVDLLISAIFLIVLGFFISVITSFYMFDIAFNLSVSIVLLPLALALWPFSWTKSHLSTVVKNVVYYTGLFIFLPLGILIGCELINRVIQGTFVGTNVDFLTAFDNDQSDIIRDKLGFFTLSFCKVLVSYAVAFKIIPLMANEFCEHFFGGAMLGNPMSERLSQGMAVLKQRTLGKMGKYGKDVAQHQYGRTLQWTGRKMGGLSGRALERYGKEVAKTKK